LAAPLKRREPEPPHLIEEPPQARVIKHANTLWNASEYEINKEVPPNLTWPKSIAE
jgi:hypothetical protein